MTELNILIEALKVLLMQPYMLAFAALFLFGFLMKEHTLLNNHLIPWILTGLGACFGALLIDMSLAGVIVGCVIAFFIEAAYDHLKPLIYKILFATTDRYS